MFFLSICFGMNHLYRYDRINVSVYIYIISERVDQKQPRILVNQNCSGNRKYLSTCDKFSKNRDCFELIFKNRSHVCQSSLLCSFGLTFIYVEFTVRLFIVRRSRSARINGTEYVCLISAANGLDEQPCKLTKKKLHTFVHIQFCNFVCHSTFDCRSCALHHEYTSHPAQINKLVRSIECGSSACFGNVLENCKYNFILSNLSTFFQINRAFSVKRQLTVCCSFENFNDIQCDSSEYSKLSAFYISIKCLSIRRE